MGADLSVRDCIRRAMSASEIAESCADPQLRDAFYDLCTEWLARADEHGRGAAHEPPRAEAG